MPAFRRQQAFECANGSTDRLKDPPPGTSHLLFLTGHTSESEEKKNHTFVGSQILEEVAQRNQSRNRIQITNDTETGFTICNQGDYGILFFNHQVMRRGMKRIVTPKIQNHLSGWFSEP